MAIQAELPGANAWFTTREDGDVRAQPERLAALAGRPVRTARQVHGAHVADGPAGEADGLVARDADEAVAVFVADCLPVLLSGPGGVAALHAGWRGLAVGILESGVATLGEVTAAALGPSARGCCYEVGEEVHAALGGGEEFRVGERNLDLARLATERLRALGIAAVSDIGACTICDERFFSHRREGTAERQAGVVWRI